MDARKRAYGSTSLRAAPRPGHASDAFVALFTFQTAHLIPAAHFASGVCIVASLTPNRGVGGAPRNVRVQRHPSGVHITRHARRLARRLASHDAGRSPLGAPPWRFWAPGAALLSPAFAPDRLQRAPRTQVVVPGGRGPEPPGTSGYKRPPQDATPRSVFRSLPEDALNERG